MSVIWKGFVEETFEIGLGGRIGSHPGRREGYIMVVKSVKEDRERRKKEYLLGIRGR